MAGIRSAWNKAFAPYDRSSVWDWACQHVKIPSSVSKPGPFDPLTVPQLRQVFEFLTDAETREVGLLAPVRSGKSLVADIWVPYLLPNDPGPLLWTMQKDDVLVKHFESRVLPIIRMAKPSAAQLDETSRRTDVKRLELLNGMDIYLGGSSIKNFQNKGCRYVILDEIWDYSERIQEALARVHEFEDMGVSKVFLPSQGGMSNSGWDIFTSSGQWWEYHVQCPECRAWFPPTFTGRRADKSYYGLEWPDGVDYRNPHGDWIVEKVIPHVVYSCRECGVKYPQTQSLRMDWIQNGEYRVTREGDPRRKIVHYESIIVRSWERILADYLDAANARRKGNDDLMRIFWQKSRALHYDPGKRSVRDLIMPKIETGEEVSSRLIRVFTLDRQAEGVHYGVIREWLNDGSGRSVRVWCGKIFSEAEIEEKAKEYGWKKTTKDNDGKEVETMVDARVGIDCSYEHPIVYDMCARHGWIAMQGEQYREFTVKEKRGGRIVMVKRSYSDVQVVDPGMGKRGQGRGVRASKIRWSNPTVKDRLEGMLKAGLMGVTPRPPWGDDDEDDYQTQMTGQWKQRVTTKSGRTHYEWRDNGNDHYRDCENMQVVFASILGFIPDIEREDREEKAES